MYHKKAAGGIILNYDDVQKAYGTRGYEVSKKVAGGGGLHTRTPVRVGIAPVTAVSRGQ
jgi:hypothetical protein